MLSTCGSGEETQGRSGMEDTREDKVTTMGDMLTTTTPTCIPRRLESDHDHGDSHINAKLVVQKEILLDGFDFDRLLFLFGDSKIFGYWFVSD